MKTSESEKHGDRCLICKGRTARDLKRRGFVRHIVRNPERTPKGTIVKKTDGSVQGCRYGRGRSD